ncbi:MAG: hypothetical protein D4S02_13245 [Rhodocyclaceae bacterium]|nr:MAG: hypothetical protein D4S02_13245 [Rhodocyclaceae bacterium]
MLALVDAAPRSATAVAGQACVLLTFSEEELSRAERLERTVLKNLASLLVSRCHAMAVRLASLKPGQCFGEVGFLNDELARHASVRAKSDSRALRVEARDMLSSPKVATTVYRHLARKLSNRLRGLNRAGRPGGRPSTAWLRWRPGVEPWHRARSAAVINRFEGV